MRLSTDEQNSHRHCPITDSVRFVRNIFPPSFRPYRHYLVKITIKAPGYFPEYAKMALGTPFALIQTSKHSDLMEIEMTDLTNKIETEGSLIGMVLASVPTAADLVEATAVLSIAALMTACLNLML